MYKFEIDNVMQNRTCTQYFQTVSNTKHKQMGRNIMKVIDLEEKREDRQITSTWKGVISSINDTKLSRTVQFLSIPFRK